MVLHTAAEVREILKIGRSTLYRLLDEGLPCIGHGRLRRFDLEAVLKWLNGEPSTSPVMLQPGLYRCGSCQSVGRVTAPMPPDHSRCPKCGGNAKDRVG